MRDLVSLPKAELHIHLEGSIRVDLLHELDDFRRVALELCGDLAAQGVRYAEVTFSPARSGSRVMI